MFLKSIYFLSLLIIKIFQIQCDFSVYKNQFSIFFNRGFNKFNKDKELSDESINHLLYNNIFATVKLGKMKIPNFFFLQFNNSDINIISSKYLNSITYNKDSIINNTILLKDKIQFPKIETALDLNFFLNIENDLINKNENFSYLGLGLNNNDKNKNSFINQLKDNNIIKNRVFSVLFHENSITADSQYDGQILFGLFPHELTIRYNEKDLYWTSIINEKNNNKINELKWQIKFDSIYYKEEKDSLNIKDAEFDISLNLIIGPEEFRQKILKNYFEKFINEKLCKEEIFFNQKDKQFYLCYSCKHHYDIEDFPTLSFYSKDFNETIIMDYNQLLCVFQDKVYLKVVFKKKEENKKWILGRGFMEVFPLVFDIDNKRIGYYKVKISDSHPLLLFFIFVFFLALFIYFLNKGFQYEKMKNLELIKRKKDDNYIENNKEKENKEIQKNLAKKEGKNEEGDMDEKAKFLKK